MQSKGKRKQILNGNGKKMVIVVPNRHSEQRKIKRKHWWLVWPVCVSVCANKRFKVTLCRPYGVISLSGFLYFLPLYLVSGKSITGKKRHKTNIWTFRSCELAYWKSAKYWKCPNCLNKQTKKSPPGRGGGRKKNDLEMTRKFSVDFNYIRDNFLIQLRQLKNRTLQKQVLIEEKGGREERKGGRVSYVSSCFLSLSPNFWPLFSLFFRLVLVIYVMAPEMCFFSLLLYHPSKRFVFVFFAFSLLFFYLFVEQWIFVFMLSRFYRKSEKMFK